jgi:hypothetical protein
MCSGIFVPLKSLWKRLCSKEIEVFNKALQPIVIQRILRKRTDGGNRGFRRVLVKQAQTTAVLRIRRYLTNFRSLTD